MTTKLSYLAGTRDGFNRSYDKRPVWGIASSSAASAVLLNTFAADNPFVYQSFEYSAAGAANPRNSKVQSQTTEISQNSYFLGATTQPTTGGISPTIGAFGVSCFGQTAAVANFDALDNGTFGFYNGGLCADNLNYGAVVTGEKSFAQSFELYAAGIGTASTVNMTLAPIGGAFAYVTDPTANSQMFNVKAMSGFQAANTSGKNIGMMAHNRNTGKLALIERSATSGNENAGAQTYRLHLFNLHHKIGMATQTSDLQNWIGAAIATGGADYKTFDFTLGASLTTASYEESCKLKVVLCDDDTLWLVENANLGGSSNAMQLWRILTDGSGNYVAPAQVATSAAMSVTYGFDANAYYGMRHMNSDDNTRVFVYAPNYYYIGGINGFVLGTDTATGNNYLNYSYSNSTSTSIAPAGGKLFVICNSGSNQDGAGPRVSFLDTTVLNGAAKGGGTFAAGLYPSLATSTWYGGVMTLKIQPTNDRQL